MLVRRLVDQLIEKYCYNYPPLNKLFLTLASFYPPWQSNSSTFLPPLYRLPLTLTSFYLPSQPASYIILPPLNKLPAHSNTVSPLLTAQFLHNFTSTEQITPHTHNFLASTLAALFLHLFTPRNNLPPHSYNILTYSAAHSYIAVLAKGHSSKISPLQPHSYVILLPRPKNPLILTLVYTHRQITPILKQNGMNLGGHSTKANGDIIQN